MYSLRKGALGGAKCVLQHLIRVAGAAKIILADFNLAVSTPIAKPPNLNPCQIFRLYSITFSSPLPDPASVACSKFMKGRDWGSGQRKCSQCLPPFEDERLRVWDVER